MHDDCENLNPDRKRSGTNRIDNAKAHRRAAGAVLHLGVEVGNDQSPMDLLEETFVAWARARPDVRAAFVVGSRARSDHPADEWSDLDLALVTTDLDRYLSTADWLAEIAEPWASYPDPAGITRHVLFEGGRDAGIAPLPEAKFRLAVRIVPLLRRFPRLFRLIPGGQRLRQEMAEAADYYRRGTRVILDKDGLAQRFLSAFPSEPVAHGPPAEQEFLGTVNEFWFRGVWTAKHLRRGELWHAKTEGCDGRMKTLLRLMMEWHAKATHGWDYDTWEDGRFLEEWADPRAVRELASAFARYDAEDIGRALMTTMRLFRWLAVETAQHLNFVYPTLTDQRVTQWVTTCMAGGNQQSGRSPVR